MGTLTFPMKGGANGMYVSTDIATNTEVKDFGTMIHRVYHGGQAPLFALLSELKTSTAIQWEHGYFQKFMLIPQGTVNGAVLVGDANITVVDSSQFIPGMVLQNTTTLENVLVTAVTNATTIAVTRAFGTTAAAAMSVSQVLMHVGNAFEEGSNRPTPQAFNPAYIKNYTQIFRNAWAVSGTAGTIKMIVGDGNIAESRADCAHFHSAAMETAMLFGQLFSGTRNGKPIRTMDGLYNMINTAGYYPVNYATNNVFAAGGTTNWTQLQSFVDPTFNQRMNSPEADTERVAFVGNAAFTVIQNICRLNGQIQLFTDQTAYGVRFTELRFARGNLKIIEHPLLNTNPIWAKMMFVLDLAALRLCYLGNRKTLAFAYGPNTTADNYVAVPDNGQDAIGGDLLTEMTLENLNIPSCAVVTNFTAAAVG